MKRSVPLKRGKPLRSGGRLNPISKRRRKQQKVRRDLADPMRGEPCWLHFRGCTGTAEHWHELVAAAHGGSRVDPRNIVPACDWCNGLVEVMSDRFEAGLKVHPWDAVPGEGGLVPAVASRFALVSRHAVHDEGEVA